MILHLSIQPSHHSSTPDMSLASQGDGGSSATPWDIQEKSSKSLCRLSAQLKKSENFAKLLHTQNISRV